MAQLVRMAMKAMICSTVYHTPMLLALCKREGERGKAIITTLGVPLN